MGENNPVGAMALAAQKRAPDFGMAARESPGTFANVLHTCQSGFETMLARELGELHGIKAIEQGPGWLRAEAGSTEEAAFPHLTLHAPREVTGDSVNALASKVAEIFFESLRGERIDAAWPNVWHG